MTIAILNGTRIVVRNNDTILDLLADQFVFKIGTARDDLLKGTLGNDTIRGGAGDDWIYGGLVTRSGSSFEANGNDLIFGGAGNDFISGGGGNDTIHGGSGNNNIHVGSGVNNVYLDGSLEKVGAVEPDWDNLFDGRNLVHVDGDVDTFRMYGASLRTHIDVEDDRMMLIKQTLSDRELTITAVDRNGTDYSIGMNYWDDGGQNDHRFLTAVELDGLFV